MKISVCTGVMFAAGLALAQQQGGAGLSFDVASVRPADLAIEKSLVEGKLRIGLQVEGLRVDLGFQTIADLVRQAYGVKADQVVASDWMSSQRYDIHAKMPEGSTKDQVPEMLQSLLAERFKLTFHRETKERQVYALTVGKNGLKLSEVEPDPPSETAGGTGFAGNGNGTRVVMGGGTANPAGADKTVVYAARSGDGGMTKMAAVQGGGPALHLDRKMTMAAFSDFLARFMDRPVVDMTGLTATYQVVLDLSQDQLMNLVRGKGAVMIINGGAAAPPANHSDTASDPVDNSAMMATVQGLGLKLEPRKLPAEIIVVDRAEKMPVDN